ncbi:MAG: hypothetical protein HRU72_09635 [Planctomycetia bacterium]|nr:MAG: hypothetical protein HRU72_09635 [Planctomycetia bacterium]TVL96171.1 MAG: hypothetical protein CV082_07980 [Candidatus Brocadia sp. BL1]HQU31004.1 DUF5908 family protein [Candidatus Brocadia sapporoensis]
MPIEIKELHIRVSVNTPQIGQPGGVRRVASGSNPAADAKEAMVAECVEQVLQIIQNKAER